MSERMFAVPENLIHAAIVALQEQAHMEAGHSQAPDLIEQEDTEAWKYAAELDKIIESKPVGGTTALIKVFAAIPEHQLSQLSQRDLHNPEKVGRVLSFTQHDMTSMGYTNLGTVEIEVELPPPDQIVDKIVVMLRGKASKVRADATAEVTQIEGKINQLLAIENKV